MIMHFGWASAYDILECNSIGVRPELILKNVRRRGGGGGGGHITLSGTYISEISGHRKGLSPLMVAKHRGLCVPYESYGFFAK